MHSTIVRSSGCTLILRRQVEQVALLNRESYSTVSLSGPLRDTGRLAEGPPGADADAGTFAPLLGWSLERKL
jgi:hypothetical protein